MFSDRNEWSKADPLTRSEPVAAFCVDFDAANDVLLLEPEFEDTIAAIGHALVDLWMGRDIFGLPELGSGIGRLHQAIAPPRPSGVLRIRAQD